MSKSNWQKALEYAMKSLMPDIWKRSINPSLPVRTYLDDFHKHWDNVEPIFSLKELSPNDYEKYKNETIMCLHCNHAFYGSQIIHKIDNDFLVKNKYNPKKHKVISPDEKNHYWLTCPSCKRINRNGFRPVVGGLGEVYFIPK